MFWDNKKIEEQRKKMFEEQRKKRLEQETKNRQQAILLKKKKKLKRLKAQRAEEEEEEEREAREEAEVGKDKLSEEKKVFIPPTLNRGFGMDLGSKGIVEKLHPTSASSSKESKKEAPKKSSGWSPHGGDEPEDKGGSSGMGNIPKLQRPF